MCMLASCLSLSVFVCVAGRAYRREGSREEPNHTTTRKPSPIWHILTLSMLELGQNSLHIRGQITRLVTTSNIVFVQGSGTPFMWWWRAPPVSQLWISLASGEEQRRQASFSLVFSTRYFLTGFRWGTHKKQKTHVISWNSRSKKSY